MSGSIRQLSLNKINYRVAADSDLSRTTGKFAKEIQATSGSPNVKLTKQIEMVEGVDIIVDGADRENLRDLANRIDFFDMAYVDSDGNAYTSSGAITITADGTADAKMTITLLPVADWTPIIV